MSSPGLFAFQSAKSRGSSLSGFGSCSSTWSGRWPESRPYSGKLRDAEVDVALDRIGVAALDQLLDEARRSRGCARSTFGMWSGMPSPRSPVSSRYQAVACSASAALAPGRGVVDLVVHVGDVVDERRVVAASRAARTAATSRSRTAARCRRGRARRPSARRSTSAPGRAAAAARRATSSRCHRAASTLRSVSSRGSAATTAQSSGPLSRPVSARRSARRSPPTAFSSRTIAFAASLPSSPFRAARAARGSARASRARRAARRSAGRGSCARARAPRSGRARRAAPARPRRERRPRAASSSSGKRRDRVDARATGCARGRSGRRGAASRARRGTRAPPRPGSRPRAAPRPIAPSARFESFFPSAPRMSPWWTYSGGVAPSASASDRCSASFGRWSLPRITCVIPKSTSSTTLARW